MAFPSPIHRGNRLDDFVWLDLRAVRCNRNKELRERIRAKFTQYLSRRLLEFPLASASTSTAAPANRPLFHMPQSSGRPICRQGGTYFGPNLTIHLSLRRGQKPGTPDELHRCDPDAHY
jgi:hypothetical protein